MKYVFIVGCGRSGTTWLQLLMAQHPEVATVQETHLFSGYIEALQKQWRAHAKDSRGIGLQAVFSKAEFDDLCRQLALSVLDRIAVGNPSAGAVVEKTPAHARHAELILASCPDAHFVHVIRDPRSVAASLAAAAQSWGRHWASTNIADNARRWMSDVEAAQGISELTPRYHEVRYEDLMSANGSLYLQSVLASVSLDASPEFCDAAMDACRIDRLRDGDPSLRARGVFENDPKGFYRQGSTSGWRSDLSASEITIVEHITGAKMQELGYDKAVRVFGTRRPARLLVGDWIDGFEWRAKRFITRSCGFLRSWHGRPDQNVDG